MKRFYCVFGYDCNNKCINCCLDSDLRRRKCTLSLVELKSMLELCDNTPEDIFEISGGEPTIDHDFFLEFLRYLVVTKRFSRERMNVLSNGQNFASREFAKEVSKYCGHITSTFYGVDAELHDSFTQVKGSFVSKLAGLSSISENNVELHIKTILTRKNCKDVPSFVDFCTSHFRNSHIIIAWLCLIGEARKNRQELAIPMESLQEAISYVEQGVEKARHSNLNLSLSIPLCLIDPFYWKGHMPGDLSMGLDKVIFIKPEEGVVEKLPADIALFNKPYAICDTCVLKRACVWEWDGCDVFYDMDRLLHPIRY